MKRIIGLFIIMLVALSSLNAQDFQCSVSINANQISSSGNQQRYNEAIQRLHQLSASRQQQDPEHYFRFAINDDLVYRQLSDFKLKENQERYKQLSTLQNRQNTMSQQLDSSRDYLSDLTSLIAYYLNLFIAVELDSFSQNGGSPYFSKCQNIVNLNQKEVGWNVAESGQSNRYWITENFTNSTYSKLHDFYYQYHRLGLDVMYETPDAGRAIILESLKLLQQVNAQKSNLAVVRIILNTKKDEIINIFKEGMPSEKTQVINIMKQIDPTNSSAYDAINAASK